MGLRFLWNATRGHRLTPWRSEYLKWRIETYSGRRADTIGFGFFWLFLWKEKARGQVMVGARHFDFHGEARQVEIEALARRDVWIVPAAVDDLHRLRAEGGAGRRDGTIVPLL